MRAPLLRPARLAMLGLGIALAATACSGGKSGSKPVAAVAPTTTTTTTPGEAYTACLRQHGVNVPDRPPRTDGTQGTAGTGPTTTRVRGNGNGGTRPSTTLPPGVDASTFEAARQACQSQLPANGGPGGPGGQNSSAFQAYTSCLKDHGVTLPANGGFGGVNRDDPAFKAADAVCAPLRPTTTTSAATTTKP